MFIVLLKFSRNKAAAADFMAAHNQWIADGFADGIFQCVGSLAPNKGGVVLAVAESRGAIEARIEADPFVANDVVAAEILEVEIKKATSALDVLKA